MKDFLGKKLNIGNRVVGLSHSKNSSHLYAARIINFTNKFVIVQKRGTKEVERISPEKVVKVRWYEDDDL